MGGSAKDPRISICRIVAAVCDRRAQETPMKMRFTLLMGTLLTERLYVQIPDALIDSNYCAATKHPHRLF